MLAGAGSGKTRVLTHRVVWAVSALGASPHNILAVTFTNKAAAEMRHRIEKLLGVPGGAMWVGTFHGIAHRLLRLHHALAGLPPGFQILDSEDQQRLIKKVIRGQELDETRYVPRDVQYYINKLKDEGLRPDQVKPGHDPVQQMMAKLYEVYEETCRRSGVVDFAELLLRAFELLRDNASLQAPLPLALHACAGRRVPGHQRHPVRLDAADGRARRQSRSWWATTTSPSTAGAARRSRTCGSSPPTTPARRCSGWSRTTAPPATSSAPPTR